MNANDESPRPDNATINQIEDWFSHSDNRREFVRGGALAVAVSLGLTDKCSGNPTAPSPSRPNAAASRPSVPLATLGGTQAVVSTLGVGTQTMGENQDGLDRSTWEQSALDLFRYAMDRGVRYFDTAGGYKRAEEFLGKAIKNRQREGLFVATKVWADSHEGARKSFERSLNALGTDYVDLVHIHSAADRNIEHVLRQPGEEGYNPSAHGAWRYLEEQKSRGRIRFLGITGHGGFSNMRELITHTHEPANNRAKVDVIMPRMSYVSHWWDGFQEKVQPLIARHRLGVMVMKVFNGPGQLAKSLNDDELRLAVRYVRGYEWAHGCVIGCSSKQHLDNNIASVNAAPMTNEEMTALRETVAATNHLWKARFNQYVARKYSQLGANA